MTGGPALPVGPVVPGWSRRPPATAVALDGRYVVLEPLADRHAPDLLATLAGPDDGWLWTYRPEEPPADLLGARAWVDGLVAAPHLEVMAIAPREGPYPGVAAGIAAYTRIEPDHGQVEIAGVLYARHLQRTRAATEAVSLAMRHALDTLGYRRFEWKCDSLNEPSRRAAVRLGFRYEGRFRRHLVVKGRSRDTDWFSVTDEEWPGVRAAHERWLDPDNFDEDGRQRTSLRAPAARPPGPPRVTG